VTRGNIKDKRSSVTSLIRMLKDGNKHIRRTVSGSLGQLGDMQAVMSLYKALNDKASLFKQNDVIWDKSAMFQY